MLLLAPAWDEFDWSDWLCVRTIRVRAVLRSLETNPKTSQTEDEDLRVTRMQRFDSSVKDEHLNNIQSIVI